ncbi:hypothetical protein Bca4012_061328 [Brassica carinata]
MISKVEAGGDRLFVSREYVEGVEVWESSNSSYMITVEKMFLLLGRTLGTYCNEGQPD